MILFLSDVGGSEILLIFLVILIFFGPKSIPGIAKSFARTIYQIKQASDEIKNEVAKSGLDIRNNMNFDKIIEHTGKEVENEFMKPMEKEINEVDKTLHSISYTKQNHNSTYRGEAELENEAIEKEEIASHLDTSTNQEENSNQKTDSEGEIVPTTDLRS